MKEFIQILQHIKTYSSFITEAYMSDYSRARYDERVGNIGDVRISVELAKDLRAEGINFNLIKDQIIELIVDELDNRLKTILSRTFGELTFAVPVLAAKLWVGNNSDYIKIFTKSNIYKKDKTGKYLRDENGDLIKSDERIHSGEKFYMPIQRDYVETLVLYPMSMTDAQIENSFEEHGLRKNKNEKIRVIQFDESHVLNLEIVDGVVKEKNMRTDTNIDYTVEQQWSISVGRKLKIFSKLTNDFIEGKIVELIEPVVKPVKDGDKKSKVVWLGPEKLVKVKLDTGKDLPTIKTFRPDDIIYLPIGTNDEMIKCKVATPPYIIDERSINPVNIKFKALQ